MAEEPASVSGRLGRLFLEGAVIVLSILIAFAIDVAWDRAQDREINQQHARSILTEMQGNLDVFDNHSVICANSLAATRGVLSLMGPDPLPVSADSLTGLVIRSFSGMPPGRSKLRTTALTAFIESGRFSDLESFELQQELTTWMTDGVGYRAAQTERYEAQVQKTIEYMTTVMPAARLLAGSRIEMPDSKFEIDVDRVLSDPTLEGILTNLGILMGHICIDDPRRQEAATRLVALLESELG